MIRDNVKPFRCAIYTRKSTDEGLELSFNSLDAQREAAELYIASQKDEGWVLVDEHYDDGGYTGGNMNRPALKKLLADIEAGQVDCVVVYKVDRLSRSLLDFARIMEKFEKNGVSFVSVTQHFNTSHSMGRLTLNILLSFAQFEREIISERTRDKIAATRRKGKWSGGRPLLGYNVERDTGGPRLVICEHEAEQVRQIFKLYRECGSVLATAKELNRRGWRTKRWVTKKAKTLGDRPFDKGNLFNLLTNPTYIGKTTYKGHVYEGEHSAVVPLDLWVKVQAQLQHNGRSAATVSGGRSGALLRGLLYCAHCQCTMSHTYTSKAGKRYRYYTCMKAQKQGWETCPTKSVRAFRIEEFVIDQVRMIGSDPSLADEAIKQLQEVREQQLTHLGDERRLVLHDLAAHEERVKSVLAGDQDEESSTDQIAEHQDRTEHLERRLAEIAQQVHNLESVQPNEQDITASVEAFGPLWDVMGTAEQARLLGLVIKRIEYDGTPGDESIAITYRPEWADHLIGIQQAGMEKQS
ncbi:recombinase family protein [Planctomycetales bacterium ZRK34]|nr:recombinase family protein [Planctomycetales bacterium ZRK34]